MAKKKKTPTPYVCPECQETEFIDIAATVRVRLIQDDPDNIQTDADESDDGSHEWDGDASAQCCGCGFQGKVNDFDREVMAAAKAFAGEVEKVAERMKGEVK